MRRFIESMDEPTTISQPDGGGVIDLRDPQYPHHSKNHDLKAAVPLVWIVVITVAVCVVVLVVRRFIN